MNGMNQVDKEGAMAAGVEVLGKREVWRMRRGRWVCCVCAGCVEARGGGSSSGGGIGGRVNEVEKGRRAKAASGEVLGKREVRRMRRGRWVCCVCAGCVEG